MTHNRRTYRTAFAATLSVLASVVQAHEFWVMPSAFLLAPDSPVRVQLFNGERFIGEVVPKRDGSIERFELVADGEPVPVEGVDGGAVGFVRTRGSGTATIVYQSVEQPSVLPADRFEAYLAEEKLTDAIESRKERAESDQPGREVYVRCAKALLCVGEQPEGTETLAPPIDKPVGLPLEIVFSPDLAESPGQICARVLLLGTPLAGVRVVCVDSDAPQNLLESLTDEGGTVRFSADHTGTTMLTALYIERTENRADADWKSYWASLTMRSGHH